MRNESDKAGVTLTLRSRDLPLANGMLLVLSFFTVCSMASMWLGNDEIISTQLSMPPEISTAFRLDINQATPPEIANLPKVGPALANAIVAYRESNGPFAVTEQLTDVSGIGPKKLAAIAPFLLPIR
jgi:competence ComEA-like helix-hairpin-helix protein